ncbi:MAG: LysM peptidoglycan-binding domain-containing protein [Defluviitaleaceae bacterium]|nr:LysM peptidoglycan-binding domain-containing protein [Defluviitaleaceae bacterium]
MSDFTLPTNIKQIGSIGDGLRIYVEDYVCTFLHQYAEAGGYGERLAFLVGRHLMIDGQPILFISGAIHGKHAEEFEGFLRFSEKSRDYAETMLDEHFPMMEIVGWMQSQPSYGTYLNQHYASYHLRQFRKAYQVMFVLDPIERSNTFYVPDPDARTPSERMAEASGYFIYYEKNTNMHEYMLANKSIDYTAAAPTVVEKTPLVFTGRGEEAEDGAGDSHEEYDDEAGYGDYSRGGRYGMEPEEVIRRHQSEKARRKAPLTEQRRALNMIASLCAVLFVVTFIMGAWIVRSQDRINEMEQQIRLLNTGYRNLFAQMHAGELTPVFAAEDPSAHDTTGYVYMPDYVSVPLVEPTDPPPVAAATPAPATPVPEVALPPEEPPQAVYFYDIPETYTIQYGDSLIGISIRFFHTADMVEAIMALNGIDDPHHIVAGRTIALPRR